jgi:NTP pyrophosphatase (non-canonical NTP hydrolase)
VQELVKISLENDRYDAELEKLLWRLATEANLTGLPTAKALNDLYTGYVAYFGPHTKDYDNLAMMARHLPEYQEIIAAIDSGDYGRAKELLDTLPANSTVRQILEQRVNEPFERADQLKEEALAGVRDALEGRGSVDTALDSVQKYLQLAESMGKKDAEMELVYGVLKGYKAGVVSNDNAKAALSDIDYFRDWSPKPVLPQAKPQEEKKVAPPTTSAPVAQQLPAGTQNKARVFGIAMLLALLVIGAGFVYRRWKHRGNTAPRRR